MVDLVSRIVAMYARMSDPQAGVSMRSWKDSDIRTDITQPGSIS